jgi:uncharacterized membrane protein YhaH (DUF805 family)
MEQLFEFMFGASRRIDRAKCWKSMLIFGIAGLLLAVILMMTAAGLAAPLFIVGVTVFFVPWLIWGFAIHTERLHDRDKSAWWLVVFYLMPGLLGYFTNPMLFNGAVGFALYYALALVAFALTIWGFVEIGCLRGTTGSNRYGPNPLKR